MVAAFIFIKGSGIQDTNSDRPLKVSSLCSTEILFLLLLLITILFPLFFFDTFFLHYTCRYQFTLNYSD